LAPSKKLKRNLSVGSGVLWTLVYLLIIKQGFQDRTFGMPLAALCANISWEFIFSFLHPHPIPQRYVNITWCLFDGVILFQFLRFGRASFGQYLPETLFYPTLVLTLILAFGAVLFVTYEFKDWYGRYAAFGQNFMMSVLFVDMLIRRGDVSGQSMYIALFKMAGSLLASILFFRRNPSSHLLNFLYVAILAFDVIYALMLYAKFLELGANLWAF
jgi:hypothetical protein